MPPLNWCNSPLMSFTASADNSHNPFSAHQPVMSPKTCIRTCHSLSWIRCPLLTEKPWSAANSSFWLCPQAQGILLQSTAYLFVFLSLEHSALSTSWLLHLFLLLVHQLLSWLPHSHSFSLKNVTQRDLPWELYGRWLLQITSLSLDSYMTFITIYHYLHCFLICYLFPQLECELQECRDFISFGHFWIPAPGTMSSRKQILNHHVLSIQCEWVFF